MEELLSAHCGDGRMSRAGRHRRLSLDDYAQIGPIMAAIQTEGGTIQDMEVTQPDLEDVFLRLMQEN